MHFHSILISRPNSAKKSKKISRVRKNNFKYLGFADINQEDLNSTPYLNNFINETLRMHTPVVSVLTRETSKALKLGSEWGMT